jgi:CheY-like chemotaxis protein
MGSQVQIRVRDTGEGIAEHFLPHVFERFRQADASITRKHMGLGLGLSIVRHVVEMHGGTVGADSPGPGQGATFTVNLPIGAMSDPAAHPQLTEILTTLSPALPIPYTLNGIRVLVVDDEENTCEIVSSLLTNYGADVRAVTSAAEAHLMLEAWLPDVILSDLGMPGEDGLTFLRKLRARTVESGAEIPAVAITAYAGVEDRLRALRAGYQSHLSKPLDAVELLTVVASLAGRLERT